MSSITYWKSQISIIPAPQFSKQQQLTSVYSKVPFTRPLRKLHSLLLSVCEIFASRCSFCQSSQAFLCCIYKQNNHQNLMQLAKPTSFYKYMNNDHKMLSSLYRQEKRGREIYPRKLCDYNIQATNLYVVPCFHHVVA